MINLILFGAPGSGKGTQSSKLVSSFGYIHVSTGDLLRAEIKKGSPLGLKVQDVMKQGNLVSDILVLELLKANLDLKKNAYIFDGFPRNMEQARLLETEILKGFDFRVINFSVNLDLLEKRITSRRLCLHCGEIFNLLSKVPLKIDTCDKCGTSLVHREDDKALVVKNRLDVFKNSSAPLLDYYSETGKCITLNADLVESEVTENLFKIIRTL